MASICCSPPESLVPWIRKQLEHLLHRKAAGSDLRRQHQVLLHVEARENAALLRAERDAEACDAIGRQFDQLFVFEFNGTSPAPDHAHDRLHRGGLAGAVAPEERDHLALADVEIHAVQDVRLAVPRVEPPNL
jgi:hypothetical protein